MEYDLTLAKKAYQLAERWNCARETEASKLDFTESDLKDFSSNQISSPKISNLDRRLADISVVVFLERLQSYPPLPSHLTIHLGDLYKFKNTPNAEIRFRFYQIALSDPSSTAAKTLAIDAAKWVIGDDETGVVKGRMKFCRPIFRGVCKMDKDLAVTTWEKSKTGFHPVARRLIEKVR